MFSCFRSTHLQYAARIDSTNDKQTKLRIATDYLALKLGQAKFSMDENVLQDPALTRLNTKHHALRDALQSPCDELLEQAYDHALCRIASIKPEAWRELKAIATETNMAIQALRDLVYLIRYDIRFAIDDSKSMAELNSQKTRSRWEELRSRIEIIARIATCLDNDGINLYFYNTEPKIVRNVRTVEDVRKAFNRVPTGYTPMRETTEIAMFDKEDGDKPILMFLPTDGSPTDNIPPNCPGKMAESSEGPIFQITESKYFPETRLEKVLHHRIREADLVAIEQGYKNRNSVEKARVKFSVMLCATGKEVEYWNGLDAKIPDLDVNCDYPAEAAEVLKHAGLEYTLGNYLAKVLLGAVIPSYDKQDEPSSAPRFGV